VNGVAFFGGTVLETKLRAYAADDGRKPWETDLPFSAHSVPGTDVRKGKRYVVVCRRSRDSGRQPARRRRDRIRRGMSQQVAEKTADLN
jgi:hypothetical protein